jgi:hypothetical protein
VQTRFHDASRGGGWLNVCDDAGIPAAIIEAAFLNNRKHARYLADPENARRYAEAVGHGVVRYLRSRSGTQHRRANVDEPDEGSFGYARESRRQDVPGAKRLLYKKRGGEGRSGRATHMGNTLVQLHRLHFCA